MELHRKILAARKERGFTQEELADLANVTPRTIQRIETGESIPRPFTLKAIAKALQLPFETLTAAAVHENIAEPLASSGEADERHFLKNLCFSCFSFLVVPFVHFLVPDYLLRKSPYRNPGVVEFARSVIDRQKYWIISLHILLLLCLAYNFLCIKYFRAPAYRVNYLWPFFGMYFLNVAIIAGDLLKLRKLRLND